MPGTQSQIGSLVFLKGLWLLTHRGLETKHIMELNTPLVEPLTWKPWLASVEVTTDKTLG